MTINLPKDINIIATQCTCDEGHCAHFVDPPEDCVYRLSGDVRVKHCAKCGSQGWYQDGQCLRCKRNPPTRDLQDTYKHAEKLP